MPHFSDRILDFNRVLDFSGSLPEDVRVMNPFRENLVIWPAVEQFYQKYYADERPRRLILGINPGRLGAGATGIPFTDTKRLEGVCGIQAPGFATHEPSSVFVYEVIEAYGGPEAFYGRYYISSLCPLGLLARNPAGRWVNCNYYDRPDIVAALDGYIRWNVRTQIAMGADTDICFIFGKKNAQYFDRLNKEECWFERYEVLEHPRFIAQYRQRQKDSYIAAYLQKLSLDPRLI